MIPLLALGVPANPTMAMLLGAFIIQGIQPGPFFISQYPNLFWGIIASMYIGNIMLLILNLPLIGMWVKILKIPYALLFPLIILFCIVGVYSLNNNVIEIIIMIIFGILGYFMKKFDYEAAPLVFALVLGPMLENTLHYRFPSIELAVEANGKNVMERIGGFRPDLILMDIRLSGVNSYELTRKIKFSHPNVIVIMFSSYDLPEYREAAFRSGADYFIPKESYTDLHFTRRIYNKPDVLWISKLKNKTYKDYLSVSGNILFNNLFFYIPRRIPMVPAISFLWYGIK
jgi:CheY-like chemotaxis protein